MYIYSHSRPLKKHVSMWVFFLNGHVDLHVYNKYRNLITNYQIKLDMSLT